jgi:hypothetical protein
MKALPCPAGVSLRIARYVFWGAVLSSLAVSAQAQQSYNYTPDFTLTTGLQVNGAAAVVPNSAVPPLMVVRLSDHLRDTEDGSAWYTNPAGTAAPVTAAPLPMKAGFTTSFTFQFTNQTGIGYADGIAFILQNGCFSQNNTCGALAVANQGEPGGNLGFTGLTKSVGIGLDVWQNTESDYGDDGANRLNSNSTTDTVFVQSCGADANTSHHLYNRVEDGVSCKFGSVDLSNLAKPINLVDGLAHTAKVVYNPPPNPVSGVYCQPGMTPDTGVCGSIVITVDGQTVLTVPFGLDYLGLDTNDDAYPGFTAATGMGHQDEDIVNWSIGTSIAQPVNTSAPTTSTFNNTAGSLVQETIDFSAANNNLTGPSGTTNLTIVSNDVALDPNTWSQWTFGTPFATSTCPAHPGNGGNGTLCSLYTNACYGGTLHIAPANASDYYCPSVIPNSGGTIVLKDKWDPGVKWDPSLYPGTTISLIDFTPKSATEAWAPVPAGQQTNPVCTSVFNLGTPQFQCDLADTLIDVYGDQTTTRGTQPKKGWLITALGVPVESTLWSVVPPPGGCASLASGAAGVGLNNPPLNNQQSTQWFNGACELLAVVSPASPANPTNGYVAAPPTSLTAGLSAPVASQTDTTYKNSNQASPATAWTAVSDTITNVLTKLQGSAAGDGTYVVYFTSQDSLGITERHLQLLTIANNASTPCPNPESDPDVPPYPTSAQPCYMASAYQFTINTDSTSPSISIGFASGGAPAAAPYTFTYGLVVNPVYTCADNLAGVSTCAGAAVPLSGGACPLSPASITDSSTLNTSGVGNNLNFAPSVTATDCAGNLSAPPAPVSYAVNPAPLTVTTASAAMTYGSTPPTITPTVTGLVNNDTAPSIGLSCTAGVTNSSKVGNYPIACTVLSNNYSIAYTNGAITVNPAPLTIATSNAVMTYGGTPPTITPTLSGAANGDTAQLLGVTCTANVTSASKAGNYPITCSASSGGNYTITYNNGSVTVNPAPLTITTANAAMTYGGTPPVITPMLTGLVNGDNAQLLGVNCSAGVTNTSNAGNYPITCTVAAGGNYAITYANGVVTVNPAAQTITFGVLANQLITAGPIAVNATASSGLPVGFASLTLSTCLASGNSVSLVGIGLCTIQASQAGGGNYLPAAAVSQSFQILNVLTITPSAFDFGATYVGKKYPQVFTVTNQGNASVSITGISIPGNNALSTSTQPSGDADDFQITAKTCSTTLAAKGSCTITVTFTPDSVDAPVAHFASLVVANRSAVSSLTASMTVDSVNNAKASLSTSSLSFGNTKANTVSAAKSVTLSNTGNTPLQLSGLAITGPFALGAATTCSNSTLLLPKGTCVISVTFNPSATGAANGKVTITDVAFVGTQTISLAGTGN